MGMVLVDVMTVIVRVVERRWKWLEVRKPGVR